MLDSATYTPRLKAQYVETIRAALKEEFGYTPHKTSLEVLEYYLENQKAAQ